MPLVKLEKLKLGRGYRRPVRVVRRVRRLMRGRLLKKGLSLDSLPVEGRPGLPELPYPWLYRLISRSSENSPRPFLSEHLVLLLKQVSVLSGSLLRLSLNSDCLKHPLLRGRGLSDFL